MSQIVELHVIQPFGHNLLNSGRDGAPKTAHLGGVRRIEVSSQCWKRQIAWMFREGGLLDKSELATRSNRLVYQILEHVTVPTGTDPERVKAAVARALAVAGLKVHPEKDWVTEYLVLVPTRILSELGAIVTQHLDVLMPPVVAPTSSSTAPATTEEEPATPAKKNKRQEKAAAKASVKGDLPPDASRAIIRLLKDTARTPQIALFGRMLADDRESDVEAACQVAFAVSTHAADIGYDEWTGSSDDRPSDKSGADMMNTSPFASGSTFYRYIAVDIDKLTKNLGGDLQAVEQARHSLGAFLRAAILAIPTGKQNSTGAQNLPAFVLCDVRQGRQRSLSDAFSVPVTPTATEHGGVTNKSVLRLVEYLGEIDAMYGAKGRKSLVFSVIDPAKTLAPVIQQHLPTARRCMSDGNVPAVDVLIEQVVSAAFAGDRAGVKGDA